MRGREIEHPLSEDPPGDLHTKAMFVAPNQVCFTLELEWEAIGGVLPTPLAFEKRKSVEMEWGEDRSKKRSDEKSEERGEERSWRDS